MENERRITFNHEDIEDVKRRMRELSDMNQELRMRIKETESQRDVLKKHLDDALAQLFNNTLKILEKENDVILKPITFDNARSILFTDGFNQLAYLKEDDLLFVNNRNRQWTYDNAQGFKWFIYRNKKEEESQSQLPLEVEEEKEPKKSFKETFHEVRIQDLPAYLKLFRYHEELATTDVNHIIAQTQWAKYERGKVNPNKETIKKLEEYANFKLINDSRLKTIRIHGFGERLQRILKEKNMTFIELSNEIGMPHSNIYNYCNREQYPLPNRGILNKISDALFVSMCYLLTGTREWE